MGFFDFRKKSNENDTGNMAFLKNISQEQPKKQEAKDILYAGSTKQRNDEKERNRLVDELYDKLTPAQVLYSSKEKLQKIKDDLSPKLSGIKNNFASSNDNKKEVQEFNFAKKDENEAPKVSPAVGISQKDADNVLNDKTQEEKSNTQESLKGSIQFDDDWSYFIDISEPKKEEEKKEKEKAENTEPVKEPGPIQKKFNETKEKVGQWGGEIKREADDRIGKVKQEVKDAVMPVAINFAKATHLDERVKKAKPKTLSKLVGKYYKSLPYDIAKREYGPDTAGMLDIGHEKRNDTDYTKDAIFINGYEDKRIEKYQSYLMKKLVDQFDDYKNKFNVDDVRGFYFKPKSEISKRIIENEDFNNFLIENKDKIKNGKLENLSVNFKKGDLYYGIHYADIVDSEFDEQGNLHQIIADTNDFNKNPNVNEEKDRNLIKAGAMAMDKGEIKPMFAMIEIVIPKAKLEKLGY